MEMGIAALSVGLSQQKVQQDIGTSVLKMEMEGMADGVEAMLPDLSQAMGIGANIDLLA